MDVGAGDGLLVDSKNNSLLSRLLDLLAKLTYVAKVPRFWSAQIIFPLVVRTARILHMHSVIFNTLLSVVPLCSLVTMLT